MKRRLTALFCALLFLLTATAALGAASVTSTPTVYLLALNDKFYDQYLPVSVNGVIYVPYTAFDKSSTGVDLGVYYGIDQSQGTTLTLYTMDGMLVFRVSMGVCEDGQGNRKSFRAVSRNGLPYVPAAAVCEFFGLHFAYRATPDRGDLVRITNPAANPMSDDFFLSSATSAMRWRYDKIISSLQPSPSDTPTAAVPSATPVPTPRPTASPGIVDRSGVTVYLAVEAWQSDRALWELFPSTVKALFLYTPDSLASHADQIRRLVAAGHYVGLVVEGQDAGEVREALDRANETLGHLARIRTHMAVVDPALVTDLTQAGWTCWQSNVSGTTAATLLSNLERRQSLGRLTLPGESGLITQVLARLRTDGYTLRQPLETEAG